MLRRTLLTVSASLAILLPGCGLAGPAHTAEPPPSVSATVTMGFTDFNPVSVRIRTGETVQWRNTSIIDHTVTADPSLAADPRNVVLPDGAAAFHSGNIPAGQVWSHTFTVPGTYRYVCLPHENKGMIGTVMVE